MSFNSSSSSATSSRALPSPSSSTFYHRNYPSEDFSSLSDDDLLEGGLSPTSTDGGFSWSSPDLSLSRRSRHTSAAVASPVAAVAGPDSPGSAMILLYPTIPLVVLLSIGAGMLI